MSNRLLIWLQYVWPKVWLTRLAGWVAARRGGAATTALIRWFVRRYGVAVTTDGSTIWAFPEAAALAGARVRELRALKYSTRKAEYIRDLARAMVAGTLDVETLVTAANAEVIAQLTALRGLGRWTADWFLARCCGRGDVCPAGDLAVRKAFDHHYGRGRTLSEEAIRRRARAWGPYQNLAVHYLLAGMRLSAARAGGGTA